MPESTLTIVFRGLMVFHRTGGTPSLFEVGLLSPSLPHGTQHHIQNHIPRINTYKNGVLDSVKIIKGLYPPPPDCNRIWQLKVEGQLGGVSTDEQGEFDRTPQTHPRDYRWLIDLEADNFHGPLTGKVDTGRLKPVLQIPTGRFYTRLQSREMDRQENRRDPEPFGRVSAAVGCDIRLMGNKADLLVAGDPNKWILTFEVDPTGNTLYEIANTPPDTHESYEDHFQHYYEIFTSPPDNKFKFSPGTALPGLNQAHPGPSPALCGGVGLGKMKSDL